MDRGATSAVLDVGLKPGLSSIEDARFSRNVRFEDGSMFALAAAARYDLEKGTLALSGSEPGALVPHVVNEQITVDAKNVDVTLAGPIVKAQEKSRQKLSCCLVYRVHSGSLFTSFSAISSTALSSLFRGTT